ncbi:MAG TPA: L,D-transpeptidase [Gemmatimonadaceae bacterium]|nr:L,D-transpeptidase [Gemmatimonadaceae bacterium]
MSDVDDRSAASSGAGATTSARASSPASSQPAPGAATSGASTATPTVDNAAAAGVAESASLSPDSVDVGRKGNKADTLPLSSIRLEVNLSARTLTVFDHDQPVATHRVAVGSPQWPTQTGDWNIKQVVWNPEWIPPDETWAEQRTPRKPGAPDNPLGRGQLVYDPPRTIHGTNEPASIGKAVSHGSIRLPNAVVTQLARELMEATGAGKDNAWYRRVQENRTEKVIVDLPQRVPIRVY